jgi:pimeloyl-ACP methyl ester carboxylesterase
MAAVERLQTKIGARGAAVLAAAIGAWAIANCALCAGADQGAGQVTASEELKTATVQAPAEPKSLSGPTIGIRYAVAPALEPGRAGLPIFVIEALGESGVEAASRGLIASLKELRRGHDLVFVDQRGVSGGGLLMNCPAADPSAGAFSTERVAPCASRFEASLLRSLNAATFAADLDAVRKQLGYERILLVGYFYGARIATAYMAQWPERVAAAALTDPPSRGVPMPLATAQAAQASVRVTLSACASTPACHAAYPNLAADYRAVRRRLARPGLTLAAKPGDPPTAVDGGALLSWLTSLTFRWRTAAAWPGAIHRLAQGDSAGVLASYQRFRAETLSQFPLAERLSVECAEGLNPPPNFAPFGPTSAAIAGSGDGLLAEIRACRSWPHSRAPAREPRPAAIPVLAITGADDLAGTPADARRALAVWRAQMVVLPHRTRAADDDWDQCVGPMLTAFLTAPERPVRTTCIAALRRPDFIVQVAGPR